VAFCLSLLGKKQREGINAQPHERAHFTRTSAGMVIKKTAERGVAAAPNVYCEKATRPCISSGYPVESKIV